jgi:hypothetical protein
MTRCALRFKRIAVTEPAIELVAAVTSQPINDHFSYFPATGFQVAFLPKQKSYRRVGLSTATRYSEHGVKERIAIRTAAQMTVLLRRPIG